jgi:protein-tyrosine phosphatase
MTRIPALASACNFRDFGGYDTADGRRVRWGQLYRSGVMSQLSEADRWAIAALGVRTVCDLRRLDERSSQPNPHFGPGVVQLHWDDGREGSPLQGLSFSQSVDRPAVKTAMIRMYAGMPARMATRVRGMFAALLSGPGVPMILHCTAGKDRTGFSAAMLLTALGVPRDVVVEDYLLTNVAVDLRARLLEAGSTGFGVAPSAEPILAMAADAQEAVLAADADYIAASFASIEGEHGSVAEYLRGVIGLDDTAREKLARSMLEA